MQSTGNSQREWNAFGRGWTGWCAGAHNEIETKALSPCDLGHTEIEVVLAHSQVRGDGHTFRKRAGEQAGNVIRCGAAHNTSATQKAAMDSVIVLRPGFARLAVKAPPSLSG